MTSLQTATLEEIRDVASRLCRDYLTGKWKVVQPEQLVVKRINGGLSNFLYYISLPEDDNTVATAVDNVTGTSSSVGDGVDMDGVDLANDNKNNSEEYSNKRQRFDSSESMYLSQQQQQLSNNTKEPHQVLLRVYGQSHGGDALESMITESVVFALLSERNFGPKLHGIFPGGRIEQYIPARPLLTRELANPKLSVVIAGKMAEIHSLNIPMSKEPDWLWNCMDRWLQIIESLLKKNDWNAQELVQIVRSFDYYEESKWLKSVIDQENYKVCFCHNDLQEGNILYRETVQSTFQDNQDSLSTQLKSANATDTEDLATNNNNNNNNNNINNNNDNDIDNDPELIIIDFEYCAYNYRGFDLANHFLEWSIDYTNVDFPHYHHHKHQYPNKQQRHVFIEAYLRKLNENIIDYATSPEEIECIENEVRIFSMFSHIFWSLWSVVNTTSNIEFGYWEYAVERLKEFQRLKQQYLAEH